MPKTILVYSQRKNFQITVPDDAKLTFGPWSPPTDKANWNGDQGGKQGTLRVYQGTKENIVAVFAGVTGFRDLSLDYKEEVAREEGAVIWKTDNNGYEREEKVTRETTWDAPPAAIEPPATSTRKPTTRRR